MIEHTIRRAQAYFFLSHVFLYPQASWLDELPEALRILHELGVETALPAAQSAGICDLAALQTQYRDMFGLTGSQCYETEFGLPHEFRQSQELADIAGFYRAFGFQTGGVQRERPDHLAVELEFMYLLALKEAFALENGLEEQAEVCRQAQRTFLGDHLGRWVHLFVASLRQSSQERLGSRAQESLYLQLAGQAQAFIALELEQLEVRLDEANQPAMQLTPYPSDYSCAGCAAAEPAA